MKRTIQTLLAALILLTAGVGAQAQIITTGAVTAGRTVLERAQLGGTVASAEALPGAYIQAGDSVAGLSLTPVYAPCDGTVEALFAHEGESADEAGEKYSGVLALRPESRYTLYATAEYAYQSIRTETLSVGQEVYLKCTTNGTHRGVGRITNIDGKIFTIEATGGEFYTGETVYVYMEEDYEYADRLGKATVVATPQEYVTGTGDIVNLWVQPGDFVEKGQLLFETVGALSDEGGLAPLTAQNTGYVIAVYAEAGSVIEKDDPLMEICPAEDLILTCDIPESEVASVKAGAAVSAGFDLPEGHVILSGTVKDISYLPTAGETTTYQARITLEADARIAPGMTADVAIEN